MFGSSGQDVETSPAREPVFAIMWDSGLLVELKERAGRNVNGARNFEGREK